MRIEEKIAKQQKRKEAAKKSRERNKEKIQVNNPNPQPNPNSPLISLKSVFLTNPSSNQNSKPSLITSYSIISYGKVSECPILFVLMFNVRWALGTITTYSELRNITIYLETYFLMGNVTFNSLGFNLISMFRSW